MKLFRSRGVTSLPDNFTIQQKKSCFWKAIFKILFKKQSSLLLNGEVIWQASDSPFSKELHGLVRIRNNILNLPKAAKTNLSQSSSMLIIFTSSVKNVSIKF